MRVVLQVLQDRRGPDEPSHEVASKPRLQMQAGIEDRNAGGESGDAIKAERAAKAIRPGNLPRRTARERAAFPVPGLGVRVGRRPRVSFLGFRFPSFLFIAIINGWNRFFAHLGGASGSSVPRRLQRGSGVDGLKILLLFLIINLNTSNYEVFTTFFTKTQISTLI